MAARSFRDRFFTPPVARALTSPSGILALGAGAALGILATVATGGAALAVVAGGAVGGAVGYGGRVALAIPRNSTPSVDPFGVDEPWRHCVQEALHARVRYQDAIAAIHKGPLHDSLSAIGDRLDDAVLQCWRVAQQGQRLSDGRKRIDDRDIQWQLQQTAAQIPPGGQATEIQARTVESLHAQLATAKRMDDLIRSTYDQLELLDARLDETVSQAIELSVTSGAGGFDPVGQSMDDIVDGLTSLREAMGSLDAPPGSPADLPVAPSTSAPAPGPASSPAPADEAQGQPGQAQGTGGS